MKRKFILLICLFLGIIIPFITINAETTSTLTIHYKRYDESYSAWDLWLWAPGQEGADFAFEGTDTYGAYAAISLTGNFLDITSLGIIVIV